MVSGFIQPLLAEHLSLAIVGIHEDFDGSTSGSIYNELIPSAVFNSINYIS